MPKKTIYECFICHKKFLEDSHEFKSKRGSIFIPAELPVGWPADFEYVCRKCFIKWINKSEGV